MPLKGPLPTATEVAGPKLPSPRPSKIDTSLDRRLTTTRSEIRSPEESSAVSALTGLLRQQAFQFGQASPASEMLGEFSQELEIAALRDPALEGTG